MSDGLNVAGGVLLGLLYVAVYLGLRHKEVRAGWARRAEEGWSWKALIPRPEQPWAPWVICVMFGVLAVNWFSKGTLWLAVPATSLCLIGLVQGLWALPPEDAEGGAAEG